MLRFYWLEKLLTSIIFRHFQLKRCRFEKPMTVKRSLYFFIVSHNVGHSVLLGYMSLCPVGWHSLVLVCYQVGIVKCSLAVASSHVRKNCSSIVALSTNGKKKNTHAKNNWFEMIHCIFCFVSGFTEKIHLFFFIVVLLSNDVFSTIVNVALFV